MRSFTLTLVTLFGLTATAFAQDPSTESVKVEFHGCNVIQRGIISKAQEEFNRMCPGNSNWGPGSTYRYKIDWKSGPAVDFFGSAFTNERYRSVIQGTQVLLNPTADIQKLYKSNINL